LVALTTLILLLVFSTKGSYANSVLVVLNSRFQIWTATTPAFLRRTGAATVNENSERPHFTREVFSDGFSHGDGHIEMKTMGVGSEFRYHGHC
ncbi:hypothetical protein B0H17DRAFT_1106529, partial [Mycena rosella]